MARTQGSGAPNGMVVQQADAYLSQANPVSTTLYTVLATTANVRIISITARTDWAVTQPTPLEVVITIDGISLIFLKHNPVTVTQYSAQLNESEAVTNMLLGTNDAHTPFRAFLLEGRSVKVEVRVTWAITQPTPLFCRVKYAKIP